MKKFAIALLAVLMLAACGSKNNTVSSTAATEQVQITEAEYPGIYWRTWREEIGGTVIDLNAYIVLNADHTGYWIAQDIGTLTWDADKVMLTVGAVYNIALTQENGTVKLRVNEFQDENGAWLPSVLEKIEKLPAEVEQMFPEVAGR